MAAPPLFLPGKELPILWEDRHFVIINKPAGLAAHPGPKTQDSVETRFVPQKRGGPWLVHRLDTDTAGCLLIARRKSALVAAQQAFAEHKTVKRYWALVEGRPTEEKGTLTTLLRRVSSAQQGWKMVSEAIPQTASTKKAASPQDKHSKPAQTSWRILASNGASSLLELTLHTGRTHQARVHCAMLGTPIYGDQLYGDPREIGKLRLLARSLEVPVRLAPVETSKAAEHNAKPYYIRAVAGDVELERFLQSHTITTNS